MKFPMTQIEAMDRCVSWRDGATPRDGILAPQMDECGTTDVVRPGDRTYERRMSLVHLGAVMTLAYGTRVTAAGVLQACRLICG